MKNTLRLTNRGRIFLAGILAASCLHGSTVVQSQTFPAVAVNNTPPANPPSAAVAPATDKPAVDKPAADKPAPKPDTEIQRDILIAMVHENINNTSTYKNVKFTVVHGELTMTGRIKNEKQRAKLIELVTGVVGAKNVHDQVEVK